MVGPYNCKVEEVFRNDVDISVVGEVDKNLGVPAPARLFLQPSSPLGSYLPLPPANMELNMGNTQALYGKNTVLWFIPCTLKQIWAILSDTSN